MKLLKLLIILITNNFVEIIEIDNYVEIYDNLFIYNFVNFNDNFVILLIILLKYMV